MENIKKAQQRLVNAIVAMHPQLCMGDEKQEELYLAMHDLTSKMAKLNVCVGECSNENSGLHLQRVSNNEVAVCDCYKHKYVLNEHKQVLICCGCGRQYKLAN